MRSLYGTLWVVAACLGVLATLFLPGCSSSSRAHAVDAPQARDALKIALDHWKKGEDPSRSQSSATPMTVQDFEWDSGAKLIDYQIVDDGKAEDANLRVQVKLTPGDASQGQEQDRREEGLVRGRHQSSVTVFRDMLRR